MKLLATFLTAIALIIIPAGAQSRLVSDTLCKPGEESALTIDSIISGTKETVHNIARVSGPKAQRLIVFFKENSPGFPEEVDGFKFYALTGKVLIVAMRGDNCSPGSLVMPNEIFRGLINVMDGGPA